MTSLKTMLPFLVLGSLFGNAGWAAEEAAGGQEKFLLAGEILIGPDRGDVRNSGARSQRERAGSYQKGAEVPLPITDEGEGLLAPRGGAPAEERAFDNRMRARAYQQGMDTPATTPGMQPGAADIPVPATSQERARDLRMRARSSYGTSSNQEIDLSHVGSDGIPLVPCRDVDNVTGRIGDDAASGSLFYIVRNGKQVKVRCR